MKYDYIKHDVEQFAHSLQVIENVLGISDWQILQHL